MAQVELAGAQVGGFQVGGHAVVPVECLVVGAQQHAAGSLALPVWPDGEDGQVMVSGAGGVVRVERGVEGQELVDPGTCGGGELRAVAGGRPGSVLAGGSHRAAAVRSVVVWTTPLAIACST